MQDPLAFVVAIAQLSAVFALWTGILTALGQGRIAATAIEAIARQPESAGTVRGTMIVGLAMAETAGIYGLFIAIVLLFVNPFVGHFL